MNRILFFRHEIDAYFDKSINIQKGIALKISTKDFRVQHIRNILKSTLQDTVRAGIVNEGIGELKLLEIHKEYYRFIYHAYTVAHEQILEDSPIALHVLLAHTRPPVMARLLRDLSTMNVRSINIHLSDLNEKSYAQASMWDNTDRLLLEGAMQGGGVRIPTISLRHSVRDILYALDIMQDQDTASTSEQERSIKIFCDMEAKKNFLDVFDTEIATMLYAHQEISSQKINIYLAIGAERGYTERERKIFLKNGFQGMSLGRAILRTEVAVHLCVGALSRW